MSGRSIRAALTPEQWRQHDRATLEQDLEYAGEGLGGNSGPVSRDGLAALALYNQEYGFTWDDVDALLAHAEFTARTTRDYQPEADPLRSLAARIARLLPPGSNEDP